MPDTDTSNRRWRRYWESTRRLRQEQGPGFERMLLADTRRGSADQAVGDTWDVRGRDRA